MITPYEVFAIWVQEGAQIQQLRMPFTSPILDFGRIQILKSLEASGGISWLIGAYWIQIDVYKRFIGHTFKWSLFIVDVLMISTMLPTQAVSVTQISPLWSKNSMEYLKGCRFGN